MVLYKFNPTDIITNVNGHDSSSDAFEFFPATSPQPLTTRNKLSSSYSPKKQTTKYLKLKNRALASDPKRPKWFLKVLGPVRVPDMAMEVEDMRMRQRKRSETGKREEEDWWGPWKFVQSLTCKGIDAVAVA